MEWSKGFWNKHGERLVYAFLALSIATVLYLLHKEEAALTIIIGMGMLFFNKARGTNEDKTKGGNDEPEV